MPLPDPATILPRCRVRLHFRLASPDGQTIDSSHGDEPLDITIGAGDLAAGLEHCLLGLGPGRHAFQLAAGIAFGARDDGLVHDIPRPDLPPEPELAPGNVVDFTTPSGQHFTGTVRSMDDDSVRVDFNHPLAGLPLRFEVDVLDIRAPGRD